jgi:hypothetical protein
VASGRLMFSEELPDEKMIVLLAPSSNSEKGKRINFQFYGWKWVDFI